MFMLQYNIYIDNMCESNPQRYQCENCSKFIAEKLFVNKNKLCFKCFHIKHYIKNFKKITDRTNTKILKSERAFKKQYYII